jgi:DNA-directed RNA polymerase specialized sigma24 family protein
VRKPDVVKAGGKRAEANVALDRELIDQCIAGEPSAWSRMYHRFHDKLLASIRAFLGRAGGDMHLIDEIAARVWYAVIRNNFEVLSRFDTRRGCRLSTFLSVVAKTEARLLLRSERRRKLREQVASKPEVAPAKGDHLPQLLDDGEFVRTLSPAERVFYLDVLMASSEEAPEAAYSQQNLWQLRHRIRKKLERFLEQSP